jgi:hypothetical protein
MFTPFVGRLPRVQVAVLVKLYSIEVSVPTAMKLAGMISSSGGAPGRATYAAVPKR